MNIHDKVSRLRQVDLTIVHVVCCWTVSPIIQSPVPLLLSVERFDDVI